MKVVKNISLSLEKLSHFNCGHCSKWWSVGDAPKNKKEWYCPWCGKMATVSKKIVSRKKV